MLLHQPFPSLSSRSSSGPLVRQGGARAASVTRCCALPNDKPKRKASIPTAQINYFHITGGEVHIHMGDGKGKAAEWDAVAMSPEAKALLQKHAVKASTALKMHNVLGFEDVGDLQHLSPDLMARLELKPLQLEPLLHMLHDLQKQQQDTPLAVGMQGQQQQQQQHGSEQPEDFCRSQHQQQHTGQTQAVGHTDASPLHEAAPTADGSPLPAASAVSQSAAGSSASADRHGDTRHAAPASAGGAAAGTMLPAAPAVERGTFSKLAQGTEGSTQPARSLKQHACVAIMKVEVGAEGEVNGVAITPDGRRAVTAGPDNELHVWDLEARSCIATLKGHIEEVLAVAITPDGRRAVSGSWDDTLRVWDLDTYACTAAASIHIDSEDYWIDSVAIAPDGQHALFTAGTELFKWAMDDSEPWALDGTGAASSIAVSPNGRLAVTGGYDHDLLVWDLDEGMHVLTLAGHTDCVVSVAITPDGRHAVSASDGKTDAMRVWHLATRNCLGTMERHGSSVTCVAITPDGRRVVSGGADCKLRVWDLGRRTCTGIMEGHGGAVRCVAITPDGRYAVSASSDDDLRMWDLDPSAALSKVPGGSHA